METIRRNLIISLRQFRRQPGLSAAILLTLGLAIGTAYSVPPLRLKREFRIAGGGVVLAVFVVSNTMANRFLAEFAVRSGRSFCARRSSLRWSPRCCARCCRSRPRSTAP